MTSLTNGWQILGIFSSMVQFDIVYFHRLLRLAYLPFHCIELESVCLYEQKIMIHVTYWNIIIIINGGQKYNKVGVPVARKNNTAYIKNIF